ncbi:Hypothetical predicted protein [Octopus vulgaris]|uniref:Uncharacterized protein n=1 Tax=Octopus vulgaris TaxID=6645 RepID=A0AA36B3F7_OCTVU|nr:Hypothetical predicted protein [Octopus vulgaris]
MFLGSKVTVRRHNSKRSGFVNVEEAICEAGDGGDVAAAVVVSDGDGGGHGGYVTGSVLMSTAVIVSAGVKSMSL